MSAALSSRVLRMAQRVKPTRKLTLAALAMCADDNTALATVTVGDLSSMTELSERAVQMSLRDLEREGLIAVRHNPQAASDYALFLPEGAK